MTAKKKEIDEAQEALDVRDDASTRTIRAQFRQKAKALQSGRAAGTPVSKKSFEELNEAYQTLMAKRQQGHAPATKIATILSSDVAGYSRLMAENEEETLEFFNLCKDVFEEIVANNHGRVFNTAGDAILAEFEYVFNAVHCAVEIQKELRAINLGRPEKLRVQFRMGLNQGEVFLQEGDLLGDAVNIAARIQTAAKPGGICLAGGIYDQVIGKVSHQFIDLGKLPFKNIPEPVRTFALVEDDGKFKAPLPDAKVVAFKAPELPTKRKKKSYADEESNLGRNLALAAAALVAAGLVYWKASAPSAGTRAAAPSSAPAASALAPGRVFLFTKPETHVVLTRGGKEVFEGTTVVSAEMLAGNYHATFSDAGNGFSEETDFTVESGKETRYEKNFFLDAAARGVQAGGPIGGPSAPLSTTDLERLMKENASIEPQSAYGNAMAAIAKGEFGAAYPALVRAAGANHGPAQYELGKLFYDDNGVPSHSFEASVYWLIQAVLSNRREGATYLTEKKFPDSFSQAIGWARKVADGNIDSARYRTQLENYLKDTLKPELQKRNLPN